MLYLPPSCSPNESRSFVMYLCLKLYSEFSTCRQFESRKNNVVVAFSFKLNTDIFIKSIYLLLFFNFMKLIHWERKGNFNW